MINTDNFPILIRIVGSIIIAVTGYLGYHFIFDNPPLANDHPLIEHQTMVRIMQGIYLWVLDLMLLLLIIFGPRR